jgi:hypothetical protein
MAYLQWFLYALTTWIAQLFSAVAKELNKREEIK